MAFTIAANMTIYDVLVLSALESLADGDIVEATEQRIAEVSGVHRHTVRRVARDLARVGVIEREPGRGRAPSRFVFLMRVNHDELPRLYRAHGALR